MGEFLITKRDGGLGRKAPSNDMISALMIAVAAAPTGLALDTTSAQLLSLADAEALGITAAYDTANTMLCHHHISEFFRMNPSGKLYVRLTDDANTLDDMCDKSKAHAKTLLEDALGNVRLLGVIHNPDATYTETLSGGLEQDCLDAAAKAQALATEELSFKRPVDIVLEGRQFNGTVGAADDLRATLDTANVSICIAADPAISATYNEYAAVGTCLGAMSLAKVHESIGWTERFNLTDAAVGAFQSAGISKNVLSKTIEADWVTLDARGFIFAVKYPGQSGIYFYGSPNCAKITSDYAYIENSRTTNKAIRLLYDGLFHRQNSPVYVDPDSGKLDPEVIKAWEADGFAALSIMEEEQEVSGLDVYVDPDQDVNGTGVVDIKFSIVPVGTARKINASIGLVLKLS